MSPRYQKISNVRMSRMKIVIKMRMKGLLTLENKFLIVKVYFLVHIRPIELPLLVRVYTNLYRTFNMCASNNL